MAKEKLLSESDNLLSCLGDIRREIKRSQLPYHENLKDRLDEAHVIIQEIQEIIEVEL